MRDLLIHCALEAGKVLMDHFGHVTDLKIKENRSSIVTAADLASERRVLELIHAAHPGHNVLGEESGFQRRASDLTWIVDPLDGTSNFAAGLPWFGVMIAVLEGNQPFLAGMYLPTTGTLYVAEKGQGLWRNGERLTVTAETDLGNMLCVFGMDPAPEPARTRQQVELFSLLVRHARNVRATNSLVDFAYTLEGNFGACLNSACKIWDLAAACLMFPEAGAVITDFSGRPIDLRLDERACEHVYPMVGAAPVLHAQVLELVRQSGLGDTPPSNPE